MTRDAADISAGPTHSRPAAVVEVAERVFDPLSDPVHRS
jgi:hypothetical protein